MIGIIIGIATAIVLTIMVKKENKGQSDWFAKTEKRLALFMSILLAVVIEVTAWGIYTSVAVETTETPEIVASANLVALQDNSSLSGSFFLGSGSVSNKNYYAFYYETDHGYKYQAVDAESSSKPVYIKYIPAGETPHIDQYSIVERNTMTADGSHSWLFSIVAWLQYGKYNPGDLISQETAGPALFTSSDDPNYYDNFRYEIHIPEGSIKVDYNIDLK